MRVHVADPTAKQSVSLDEFHHLVMCRNHRLRQKPKVAQDCVAMAKISQCELANHKRMDQHLASFEQGRQSGKVAANVLRPHRGIDQDHLDCGRRRRPAVKPGWLPPKRANRRAASRSTSSFSARWTRADFSFTPVYSCALARRSSSSAKVVRTAISLSSLSP
jgi:hypothetical protein